VAAAAARRRFAIFLLSLAGFPLTGGFIGKLYILRGLTRSGASGARRLAGDGLADLVLLLPARRDRDVHAPGDAHRGLALTGPATAALAVAALGVLFLFFYPAAVLDAAQQSVVALFGPADGLFGLRP
jgi:NADH-quinone oxidoreductase subunit N